MNVPRQSSFAKGQRGASLSEGDMKVASKPKRALFKQSYWQKSNQHPDNLHGNPDARRVIEDS